MTDTDPVMHGRIPWLSPGELNPEQRKYYETLLSGPRDVSRIVDPDGRLYGAFNSRLLDPEVGTAVQQLGAALRFGTRLSDRERELTILMVAAHERCDYEWHGHVDLGRRAGLTDEQLEAVSRCQEVHGLGAEESLVHEVSQALLADADLDDDLFDRARVGLGVEKLFAVVSLVGHYRHTSMSIRVWRVPLKPGWAPVFKSRGAPTP